MLASRFIWYQLVDSADGQPYKATSPTKVSVSLNANVADFRKAVQFKWDNPGYLNVTPVGALIAYKNKDAFDKRNAAEDKEEPLEADSLITNLGATEEEALIVLVPQTPSSPELLQDISEQLYEDLTRPFSKEPTLSELKQYLESDPLVKIPLCSNRYQSIFYSFNQPEARKFKHWFVPSTTQDFNLANLVEEFVKRKIDVRRGGLSSLISYVDLFMRFILQGFLECPTLLEVQVFRDSLDFSYPTHEEYKYRPEFLLYVNSCLILRGEEEKKHGGIVSCKVLAPG